MANTVNTTRTKNPYGELSYNNSIVTQYGTPVEDLANTAQTLFTRGEQVKQLSHQLQGTAKLDKMKVSVDNASIIDEQLSNIDNNIQEIAGSDEWWKAGDEVMAMATAYQSDEGRLKAMNAYAKMLEHNDGIDAMEGWSEEYKNAAKSLSSDKLTKNPDTGKYTGGFTGFTPNEYQDGVEIIKDAFSDIGKFEDEYTQYVNPTTGRITIDGYQFVNGRFIANPKVQQSGRKPNEIKQLIVSRLNENEKYQAYLDSKYILDNASSYDPKTGRVSIGERQQNQLTDIYTNDAMYVALNADKTLKLEDVEANSDKYLKEGHQLYEGDLAKIRNLYDLQNDSEGNATAEQILHKQKYKEQELRGVLSATVDYYAYTKQDIDYSDYISSYNSYVDSQIAEYEKYQFMITDGVSTDASIEDMSNLQSDINKTSMNLQDVSTKINTATNNLNNNQELANDTEFIANLKALKHNKVQLENQLNQQKYAVQSIFNNTSDDEIIDILLNLNTTFNSSNLTKEYKNAIKNLPKSDKIELAQAIKTGSVDKIKTIFESKPISQTRDISMEAMGFAPVPIDYNNLMVEVFKDLPDENKKFYRDNKLITPTGDNMQTTTFLNNIATQLKNGQLSGVTGSGLSLLDEELQSEITTAENISVIPTTNIQTGKIGFQVSMQNAGEEPIIKLIYPDVSSDIAWSVIRDELSYASRNPNATAEQRHQYANISNMVKMANTVVTTSTETEPNIILADVITNMNYNNMRVYDESTPIYLDINNKSIPIKYRKNTSNKFDILVHVPHRDPKGNPIDQFQTPDEFYKTMGLNYQSNSGNYDTPESSFIDLELLETVIQEKIQAANTKANAK